MDLSKALDTSGVPEGAESPSHEWIGRVDAIWHAFRVGSGKFEVEGQADVWLEVSLDAYNHILQAEKTRIHRIYEALCSVGGGGPAVAQPAAPAREDHSLSLPEVVADAVRELRCLAALTRDRVFRTRPEWIDAVAERLETGWMALAAVPLVTFSEREERFAALLAAVVRGRATVIQYAEASLNLVPSVSIRLLPDTSKAGVSFNAFLDEDGAPVVTNELFAALKALR